MISFYMDSKSRLFKLISIQTFSDLNKIVFYRIRYCLTCLHVTKTSLCIYLYINILHKLTFKCVFIESKIYVRTSSTGRILYYLFNMINNTCTIIIF